MSEQKKGEFIGSIIGLLIIYIVSGVIYFVSGHDLLNTLKFLAIVTFILLLIGIPTSLVIVLVFFVSSKIKR
jgi:hypothetical protein